jgi:SAM-dependent methyltransferase
MDSLLLAFSRPVDAPDYPGGTARANIDNALDFMCKTVPDFMHLVRGRSVLDFGCGYGLQAAALARMSPDSRVVGVDLPRQILQNRWRELRLQYPLPNLTLTTDLPIGEQFDVVYSCSSFEHFSDPAHILSLMRDYAKPDGGIVVISFAEPWFSPHGSHTDNFTKLPYVNLLFPESVVMRVRSRYRSDGARCYEDVEGGLNRMTVAKFERLMRASDMRIQSLRLFPTKGLPIVSSVPVLRELLTSACSCVLIRT